MAKQSLVQKNKSLVYKLFLLLVVFLGLSLVIPAIGSTETSSALWIDIVTFFESVKIHFSSYWMFYTFGGAVFFAYLGKK